MSDMYRAKLIPGVWKNGDEEYDSKQVKGLSLEELELFDGLRLLQSSEHPNYPSSKKKNKPKDKIPESQNKATPSEASQTEDQVSELDLPVIFNGMTDSEVVAYLKELYDPEKHTDLTALTKSIKVKKDTLSALGINSIDDLK